MKINPERIQTFIHKLEVEGGRWLNYLALLLMMLALAVWYDTHCYTNFNSAEAMDAAQVARHLAEGRGFTTDCVMPFDIYLLQQHHGGATQDLRSSTNIMTVAQLDGNHPDLANAPLYPLILAGLFTVMQPEWKVERHQPFWSDGIRFARYKPEFAIALLNQLLLLVVVYLTFIVAKTLLDLPAAWLVSVLMVASDSLWKASVSGLPTLLLLTLFLGLIWCLIQFEAGSHQENTPPRRLLLLAAGAGLLVGLGMLTRYAFGWVIIPTTVFLVLFGGARRTTQAGMAAGVFGLMVLPWLVRNWLVSGTFFGTAGYEMVEDTMAFPGLRLMQSLSPDMSSVYWMRPYLVKFIINFRLLMEDDVPRLGGGWIGVLFLAGLLLSLRSAAARRLRYFGLMCLGVFLVTTAMLSNQEAYRLGPGTADQLLLLTPLAIIFGVATFLNLLDQLNAPSFQVRSLIVVLVASLSCLPMILTLLPPKTSPSAFPPYYPPDIQRISNWLLPDDLMMSDIPWAVAWYGRRQCTLTTANSKYDFFTYNDYVKHISGLYLTRDTMDAKLFSECLQGGVNSWSSFVFDHIVVHKINVDDPADTLGHAYFSPLPDENDDFPLKYAPSDVVSGLFLTDRQRWRTAP